MGGGGGGGGTPSENPEKRVLCRNSFLTGLSASHAQLGEMRNMLRQSLPLILTLKPI